MSRRLLLLNICLLALIIAGVLRLRRDAIAFSAEHSVDRILPDSGKASPKAVPGLSAAARQEWTDIAAHNPFSFDRNDVTLVVGPPAPAQPRRPKPVLFGTMILGQDRLAMLSPGDSGNRSSRPVRSGEVFDGWTLVEIQRKSVTMQWEDIKEVLILNDPTSPVARDFSKTGGANSASPAIVNVAAPAPAAQNAPPAPSPTSQPAPRSSTGKKQILVRTPFGNKIMEVDDTTQ